ncbi:NAD(P)H-dependent oxidoreductase [Bisbaumannia pacifica]|uniref:NAD(P)H-dependent oxidoreductase n=1 Tax=Bisbaumannia pacifica TaxID=77098 RepID=A0ABD4L2D8_9GAMM|nr:NAD(P)H-dependent oxidoreductase [Halomonas pacifica]MBH8580433.1 NAD(P)H-dependent oxidoreductase [Halomonas pacifica]
MAKHILILQGHPDARAAHLGHALADHYRRGAESAGHRVTTIALADLDFPLLASQRDWETRPLPEALEAAQAAIADCQHLVLIYPLWLGEMPALVKGFLEQVLRPGFAFHYVEGNPLGRKGLKGRSARVIITMGMPASVYRHLYRAHSLKSLERNVLGFVGFAPVRATLIGGVEHLGETRRQRWFTRLERLGAAAD